MLTAAAWLLTCGQAAAQEPALTLDFGASHSLPPAGGVGVASTYLNGGIRLGGSFGSGGFFHAGGFAGLALTEDGASWASALAGGGWVQPLSSHVALGLTATGEAFTVGQPVPYRAAYLQAQPELLLTWGTTSVKLNAYGGFGVSEVTTFRTFVRDTRFGPRVFDVGFSVGSDLWAWGGGAQLRQQIGAFAPRVAVEAYQSPQGPYSVWRLSLEAHSAVGIFYAEGAWWDTPDGTEPALIAGVNVRTGRRSAIRAFAGRFGPDPLLDSPAGGAGGASMSFDVAHLGPTPELSWDVADGRHLTLSLRLADAERVECVGDFTEWERVPMQRIGDSWRLVWPVEPGAYHFGFFVDGTWYVPSDAPGRSEDDWGQVQATVIVAEPDTDPGVTSGTPESS